jgi:Protein of unknown function (DUF1573)
MKPLFVCLFFSFLLTSTADIAAQEAKQNPATAAKMPAKTVPSGSVAPKATPASAPKPATAVAKKAKKSTKPASDKSESKGLFEDDYDGDVGIKYIGTEPASDEELARVREVERNAKSVKSPPKPAATPAPRVEKTKVTEVKTEVRTEGKTDMDAADKARVAEVKAAENARLAELKAAEKAAENARLLETKAAEKAKLAEAKAQENAKLAEAKRIAAENAAEKTRQAEAKAAEAKAKTAEAKAAENAKLAEAKRIAAENAAEKVRQAEAKAAEAKARAVEARAVESAKMVEVKSEPIEVKSTPKPAVKPAYKSTTRGAHAEFDAMTIDLGNIKEDAILERYFEFTNTGNSNLEILECRGSCGCIQPRAESTVIAAGERGRIYVKYVARNKVGPQKPVVTLTTNG